MFNVKIINKTMKKYIVIIISIVSFFFISCSEEKKTDENVYPWRIDIKAGDGSLVNLFVILNDDFKSAVPAIYTENFVQKQFDIVRNKCRHPRTYVPSGFIGISIVDTIKVKYNDDTIIVYKYECFVDGYAKNSFGVEDDINITVGDSFFDTDRFLVKNYYPNGYRISDISFKQDDMNGIPFEYKEKKYFINTYDWKESRFVEQYKANNFGNNK